VYEDRGVGSFWSVDPDQPSITAWDLVDGRYIPARGATGDEVVTLTRPYEVTVSPGRLVAG